MATTFSLRLQFRKTKIVNANDTTDKVILYSVLDNMGANNKGAVRLSNTVVYYDSNKNQCYLENHRDTIIAGFISDSKVKLNTNIVSKFYSDTMELNIVAEGRGNVTYKYKKQ